jgi:hypothetical protein
MAQSDTDLVVSRDALGMADLGIKPQTLATQGTNRVAAFPSVLLVWPLRASSCSDHSRALCLTSFASLALILLACRRLSPRALNRDLTSFSAGPPILLRHRGQRGPQVQGHIDRASHPNQPQRV